MNYYDFDNEGLPFMDTHLPYCGSLGEDTLVGSEVFRRNHMTLYCNVPMEHLPGAVDLNDPIWDGTGRIDFLICKDQQAQMAIALLGRPDSRIEASFQMKFHRRNQRSNPRLLSCAAISEQNFICNQMEPLLQALERLMEDPQHTVQPCQIHLLTQEEFQRYSLPHKGLLIPTDKGTYITEYGVQQGLFRARTSTGSSLFCGFPQDLSALEKAEYQQDVSLPDAVRLQDRISRIQDGLPCSASSLAEKVRHFADMPLSEYFRGYPTEWSLFQALLGPNAVYRDAARYVSAKMRQEQPGVCAFNGFPTNGKVYMQYLAAPILASLPAPYKIRR